MNKVSPTLEKKDQKKNTKFLTSFKVLLINTWLVVKKLYLEEKHTNFCSLLFDSHCSKYVERVNLKLGSKY
jgi:hypothetical protein